MNERSTSRYAHVLYICAILVLSLFWLSVLVSAGNSFTQYDDVQQVLAYLTAELPPELKSSDVAVRRKAWPDWIRRHDRDIRNRLVRGDEDTLINWLLFGTSFTPQPSAAIEASATPDGLPRLVSSRIRDFISALVSADSNERIVFARGLLRGAGYEFDSIEQRSRLEQHLYTEVRRVIAERQKYMLREEEFQAGDVVSQLMAQSTLFRDRGLSLDTSILPGFAIEQALETMRDQGLLRPDAIRRVAVIGAGLDFADKNSGYDFYPVQTLQPFTAIDSLVRLGLAAGPTEIELTTFDISRRVNDHILVLENRAKAGAPYVLQLPIDLGSQWTPGLVSYWKSIGDQIGSETAARRPPDMDKRFGLRRIEVRPQVAARLTPVDFNVVTEKWTGPPFDLVIATNVLVYYDRLDQSLAFAGLEAMLRPGGFLLTNNAVVELPVSQLRSLGVTPVRHSPEVSDHIFWYRR